MAILVGIDPGVKTGFAVWDTTRRKLLRVETLTIVDALKATLDYRGNCGADPVVYFEDARLRKWLPQERNFSEYRGKLMGAGSVKRDCEIWETFCLRERITFHALPPTKGLTKWSPEAFAGVTGWKGRTSNHARDAAMLVFGK